MTLNTAEIECYLPLLCWSHLPSICVSLSFQAAGVSHTCPSSSLWRGRTDPSLGIWFHAVREHLPWAAAQEGVTSISQKLKNEAAYQSSKKNKKLFKGSAYLDHLSCVRSAKSYLNYIVASLNAHKKIRAAVLMYSYCIDCLFQQSTLHALCSSRLLCCSICTTWHR